MNECFIYIIKHPDTLEIRYVGQTTVGKKRFKLHLDHAKCLHKTPIQRFIKSLLDQGKKPVFAVLERCTLSNIDEREMHWITYFNKTGIRLLNLTRGGEGAKGRTVSEETRHKMREAAKGRKVAPHVLELIKETQFKAGVSSWNKGIRCSEDQRKKMSADRKGKVSVKLCKPILCDGIQYPSLNSMCRTIGISPSSACRAVKSARTYRGHQLSYVNG